MAKIIHVMNASSRKDTGITEELSRTLEPLRFPGGPEIDCVTLEDGPNGITTSRDSDLAAVAVARFIEERHELPDTGAFVVACFSDPGIAAAREFSSRPVLGIGEAGVMTALAFGGQLGLISVSAGSEGKNRRALRALGVEARLAGAAALGLDYGDLRRPERVLGRLIEVGASLRELGAGSLLFAGAGMGRYCAQLEQAVGLPVVDPTQAAVGLALSRVQLAAAAGAGAA